MAGQTICSKKFLEQVEELDILVASIGGDGMTSGTCLKVSSIAPYVKVYAAKSEQIDDAMRSSKAQHVVNAMKSLSMCLKMSTERSREVPL